MSCKVPAAWVTVNASGTFPLLGFSYRGCIINTSFQWQPGSRRKLTVLWGLNCALLKQPPQHKGGGGRQQGKKNTKQQLEVEPRVSQSGAVESGRLPEVLFSSVKNICAVLLWKSFPSLSECWMEHTFQHVLFGLSGLSKSIIHNNSEVNWFPVSVHHVHFHTLKIYI